MNNTLKPCEICGKEFQSQRSTKRFCSNACKLKANRVGASVSGSSVVTTSASESKSTSDREQQPTTYSPALAAAAPVKFDDPEKQALYERWLKKLPKTEWVSTGTPLDDLVKLPKNKITLIYGKFGIGKTTLANLIAARTKLKTLYIDTEASLTPERLTELGIDDGVFDTQMLGFVEDVYDLLTDEKTLAKYDLIVWDSLAATSFRTEVEGDSFDANIGVKPKMINKMMRILPTRLEQYQTTMLLINQEREGIGMYAPNYVPGGKGQMYSASVVIRLTGNYPKIKAEVIKSRVSDSGKLEFSL